MRFSIHNLLRFKPGTEARGAAADQQLARRLVNRGIAAEGLGRAGKALECFSMAVRADQLYAPAHMNLGLALQTKGEMDAAIASYERAIAIDPGYAAAHYNLGRLHLLCSRFAEAEAGFRTALRIREEFPEAWVSLAGALEAAGRNEDALSALERAIALRSDYAGALLNAIGLTRKMGRLEVAAAMSRRLLELEPESYLAHATLGMRLQILGQLSEAESHYRLALTFNPDYPEARANLASVIYSTGRVQEAIVLIVGYLADNPGDARLRRVLAQALDGLVLSVRGNKHRDVLLSLCRDEGISLQFLNSSIVAAIKADTGFQVLQESVRRGDDPLAAVVPAVTAFMRDALVVSALPRMALVDEVLERVLTQLRRSILLRCEPGSDSAGLDAVPAEFICALARQCFFSGYAFFADSDEIRLTCSLREMLENMLRDAIATLARLELPLAVFSLYESLGTLRGFERLLERPSIEWSETFRPMLQEQIANRERERVIAAGIASITAIDDPVSVAVRGQYEDDPYPRWVTVQLAAAESLHSLRGRLCPGQAVRERPHPAQILVAGCGTGMVAIQFASTYPDCEILAVDLSLSSLAYAARMTEHFGLSNVTYRQADILRLGDLDRRFAVIECSGVLHHLRDPIEGWRVLVGLLESDGLMRVALYSEKARAGILAAQEFARCLHLSATADGIRSCRRAIVGLPDGHPARMVTAYGDFYTRQGCRDMLMHVQEHRFTLPRVKGCLDQLGLRFLRLESKPAARKRLMELFPNSESDDGLEAWHRFEQTYPETFIGMYVFWCCRK